VLADMVSIVTSNVECQTFLAFAYPGRGVHVQTMLFPMTE